MFNTMTSQIQLALVLKLSQLQKEQVNLDYHSLEAIFDEFIWKQKTPPSLSSAVNDVFSLTVDEVIIYLNRLELLRAKNSQIEDYFEVFNH